MYQACTTFHFFTFRPDVSFNDPKSPDGKSWNSALKFITRMEHWGSLQWGKRLDCESTADLFIYWESYDGLAAFLAKGYLELLSLVEPLLLDLPSTPPYACDRRPFLPLRHDYVSSAYELRFDLGLNESTKLGLAIAQQTYRLGYQNIAAKLNIHGPCPGLDIEGLFLRIDMVWLMRCPLSSPSPSELERLLSATDRPGPDPKTLLLITSWKDQEAEKNIHREYRRLQNSQDVEDPLTEDILSKATSFTKHQVALEEITEDNVEFLDSEEKYKTWMSRMLAEENARKRERLARDDIRHAEWEKSGRRIATSQKHE